MWKEASLETQSIKKTIAVLFSLIEVFCLIDTVADGPDIIGMSLCGINENNLESFQIIFTYQVTIQDLFQVSDLVREWWSGS